MAGGGGVVEGDGGGFSFAVGLGDGVAGKRTIGETCPNEAKIGLGALVFYVNAMTAMEKTL